jgi:UrcA family protein
MLSKLVVIGLAAALVAQAAVARQPVRDMDVSSVRVSYADLDLSRPVGTDVLLRRIRRASEAVCGPAPSAADVVRRALYRDCITDSTRGAVASVGAVMVTALASGSARTATLAEGGAGR